MLLHLRRGLFCADGDVGVSCPGLRGSPGGGLEDSPSAPLGVVVSVALQLPRPTLSRWRLASGKRPVRPRGGVPDTLPGAPRPSFSMTRRNSRSNVEMRCGDCGGYSTRSASSCGGSRARPAGPCAFPGGTPGPGRCWVADPTAPRSRVAAVEGGPPLVDQAPVVDRLRAVRLRKSDRLAPAAQLLPPLLEPRRGHFRRDPRRRTSQVRCTGSPGTRAHEGSRYATSTPIPRPTYSSKTKPRTRWRCSSDASSFRSTPTISRAISHPSGPRRLPDQGPQSSAPPPLPGRRMSRRCSQPSRRRSRRR